MDGTIEQALQASLDPQTPSDVRQQALTYLEQQKSQPYAPSWGFALAEDWEQADFVRYYGLQLLEHGIRHHWDEYSGEQAEQLRTWVKCLAGSVREQDALFVRSKIAQLWVEVAKRCWGGAAGEWREMDGLLMRLWEKGMEGKGLVNKVLVLYVLENLSEDICNREDATAGLRLEVLGSALNEIVVPQGLYDEHLATRGTKQEVRSGPGGWSARICELFAACVKQIRLGTPQELRISMAKCAGKALNALKSILAWVSLKAALEVAAVDCLFLTFETDDFALQTAAVEALYALLNRPSNAHFHDTWLALVHNTLLPDRIAVIKDAYSRAQTSPGQDDEMYTLQKKISETLSVLADSVANHPSLLHNSELNVPSFFALLLGVLESKSLVISIPVLHSWTKLLAAQETGVIDTVTSALGTLLQTCSARLINYESLPETSDDWIVQFLWEDFDTMPERHAFLGNYRRYCTSVIETITRQRPLEALSHVLEQTKALLESGPYTTGRGFNSAHCSKSSPATLQFDAQFNVVMSVVKGITRWSNDISAISHEDPLRGRADEEFAAIGNMYRQWSHAVIGIHVDDPEVAAQVLTMLSCIVRSIKAPAEFALLVVQHMLTMRLYDNVAHATYSETVKNFDALRVVELQKVALVFANDLLDVYQQLENRVNVLVQRHTDDPRLLWGYKAFLFMIIHRATGVNNEMRLARLQQMIRPIYDVWQDPALGSSVGSLDAFCETLGLGRLGQFYQQYRFDQVPDWSSQQLDDAGQARQAHIKGSGDKLPLRMTKSMLAATTEKLKEGTDEHDTACALWAPIIPVILPNLLQMIRQAQAFNNLANWSQLPEELQMVIKRTLQDRFWQSGISNESRDEFYARISGSKGSYEGFASAVRGVIRNVREQGYHIIYLTTKFEEQFYGLTDLAEPLAQALFDDAESLSANHLHPLINLATGLVQRCPPHYRSTFLPPLLTRLFTKLDAKISGEWAAIGQASQQSAEDDDLSEEMRMESVLRQLTFSMVSFVAFLLEHDRHPSPQTNGHHHTPPSKPALSTTILSDTSILEPLILFCTHALRMRDSRCCTTICRVFSHLIPLFQTFEPPAPQVREFISTAVLKACIESLNEPYFADMQRDLASLIAQVLLLYSPKTATPRGILLSLPDMSDAKVDKALARIAKLQNSRQQRAVVLDLLEGVRGVSIHEAGKLAAPKKAGGGGVQQQYMEVEQRPVIVDGEETGLDGVAGLFGGEA